MKIQITKPLELIFDELDPVPCPYCGKNKNELKESDLTTKEKTRDWFAVECSNCKEKIRVTRTIKPEYEVQYR